MKINKKWIKKGLIGVGVTAVGCIGYYLGCHGKIDMDTAYKIGESGWFGGTHDALDMIPRDKEITLTEEMRHEILDKLDETVKLSIRDNCVVRHFPSGFNLRDF